jgi:hypothetical protein
MSLKSRFLLHIELLQKKYEMKEKEGIFFKLEKNKEPSEILGVLNFLKDKIEKWDNTNIYSYIGSLFNRNTTLVIGSSNSEEAINIIKYVYLTQVIKKDNEILDLKDKFENIDGIERFLSKEISNNIESGYPNDPKLEIYLRNHLEKLLSS